MHNYGGMVYKQRGGVRENFPLRIGTEW